MFWTLTLPTGWIYLLAVDDDHMITSVIERVVDWLIFAHQIFCHDLMLSNSNQWDWLSNEKAPVLSVISEHNLGRLERILPLGVIEVPGLGKRRPLLHPLKPRHLSLKFLPHSQYSPYCISISNCDLSDSLFCSAGHQIEVQWRAESSEKNCQTMMKWGQDHLVWPVLIFLCQEVIQW